MRCPKDCANCCKDIILPLGIIFDQDDIRWIEYHNLEVVEKDGKQWVKINQPCSKLRDNKCSIYETRPENCQIFLCEKLLSQYRQTGVSSQKLSNA
jgi:Fe-S-cluster containining protein